MGAFPDTRRAWAAAVGALLLAACGGKDAGPRPETSPGVAREVDPCASEDSEVFEDYCTQSPEELAALCAEVEDKYGAGLRSYEDFEFGAASGWYTNNDFCYPCQQLIDGADPDSLDPRIESCRRACKALQSPSYFAKPVPAEQIPWGRCSSQFAMHISAGPFTDWGGMFGTSIPQAERDAGDCTGVAFWARVGPSSGVGIRVQFADKYTDENYREPDEDSPYYNEPLCNPETTDDNAREGCDKWGSFATLGQQWRFFTLPFIEMRQAGWGKTAPDFETWALRSVAFTYGVGTWDLWIDDIAYYGCEGD